MYLLEAPGVAAVCLNGEWLPGDPYGVGWFRPPASVREGKNWMLAHLADPAASPRLVMPDRDVAFLDGRFVGPSVEAGEVGVDLTLRCSIPVVNATARSQEGLRVRAQLGENEPRITPVRRLDGLLVAPVPFVVDLAKGVYAAGDEVALRIELLPSDSDDKPIAAVSKRLRVVSREQPSAHTFFSEIDGSAQRYWVKPPSDPNATAVLLALHDAGQSADDCLAAYPQRGDAWIVAPEGRGRWGFDWEKWSRRDALEALDAFVDESAAAGRKIDTDRVCVDGRGMGGHGALRIATLHPDRFAAVGMTNPWISFFTQGRAVAPSGAPRRSPRR